MSGPLNISIATDQTKTNIPMFVEKTYVKVRFAKVQQDSVPDKGDVIKFEFDLVDPAPNQEGGTILPGQMGSKVFVSVQLYDKNTKPGDPAPKWATERICKIQDAFLGTGDPDNKKNKPPRPPFNAELVPSLIGQIAFLQFKNGVGEYSGKQDVSSYTFPGDVAGA